MVQQESPKGSVVGSVSGGFRANGGSSTTDLELEQLANTNLLIVRIKWCDRMNTEVTAEVNNIMHAYKGYVLNPIRIENYEYLSDYSRLKLLKENKDVYLFENGAETFAASYDAEESSYDWMYDLVLEAQFNSAGHLKIAAGLVRKHLEARTENQVSRWSISTNERALTRPGNLYIKGIPKDLSIDDLIPIFSKFGSIVSLKLISDTTTNQPLGYGFLSYQLGSHASECMHKLNGQKLQGSTLFINYHVERRERERIYWDHFKENTDDEQFRGVFVGNLPLHDKNGALITPAQVVAKFKLDLLPEIPSDSIISYYFPKQNSMNNVEYMEEEEEGDQNENEENGQESECDDTKARKKVESKASRDSQNADTCPSQNEEYPLKGYGFIKFKTHEDAIKAIEILTDYEWLGNTLTVNKAVQNRPHHHHHHHHHYSHGGEKSAITRKFNTYNYPYVLPQGFIPRFASQPNSYAAVPRDRIGVSNEHTSLHRKYNSFVGPSGPPHHSPIEYFHSHMPMFGNPVQETEFYDPYSLYNSMPSPGGTPVSLSGSNNRFMSPASTTKYGFPIPMKDQQESNIYVKHIPYSWKDKDLYDFYRKFGEVISAKVITVGGSKNKEKQAEVEEKELPIGSSRGYGFVYFKNPLDASQAILNTDRYKIDKDHTLHVAFAQKRAKSVTDHLQVSPNGETSSPKSNTNNASTSNNSSVEGYDVRRYSHSHEYSPSRYNVKFLNAMRGQQWHKQPVAHYSIAPNYIPTSTNWPFPILQPIASIPMSPPSFLTSGQPISLGAAPFLFPQSISNMDQ